VRGPIELPLHARLVPFFTAMVAVLAALGTLYSHHRSIQALALRNHAVLLTAKATDQYNHYETAQLRATLYQLNKRPKDLAEEERLSYGILNQAQSYEREADGLQDRATALLTSFETLEIATTLFEISIAFASIAALTGTRLTLLLAACLTAAGLIIGIIGYFQAH
jgi:hypothetical protein